MKMTSLYAGSFGGTIGALLGAGEWRTALIIAAITVSTWRIAWPLENERKKRAAAVRCERAGDAR